MAQVQEALALGNQLDQLAGTLGYTPEARASEKKQKIQDQMFDEYMEAVPTRETKAKNVQLQAQMALEATEIKKGTDDYFTENPLDFKKDVDKQYKAYSSAMREKGLYNPRTNMQMFTMNMVTQEEFLKAKNSAGLVFAKDIAKTYEGSIQNMATLEASNVSDETIQEGAAGLATTMNDSFARLDPDIKMSLKFTGRNRKGDPLYELVHTDMAEAAKYDRRDNHKFSTVTKQGATLAEIKEYTDGLLAGNLSVAPSAYVKKEQLRVQGNTDNRLNAPYYYSFAGNGVLQAYETEDVNGTKTFSIAKGGDGPAKGGYPSRQDAMSAMDSVKLSPDEDMKLKNAISSWYAENPGEKMPLSVVKQIDAMARNFPSVQRALKVSGAGSEKAKDFTIKTQKVLENMFSSDVPSQVREAVQGITAIYGPKYAAAGYSPDQLASVAAKAYLDYEGTESEYRDKFTLDQHITSAMALGLSGSGDGPKIKLPEGSYKSSSKIPSAAHQVTQPSLKTLQGIIRDKKADAAKKLGPAAPETGVLNRNRIKQSAH